MKEPIDLVHDLSIFVPLPSIDRYLPQKKLSCFLTLDVAIPFFGRSSVKSLICRALKKNNNEILKKN